jgi:hypothetical protein
MQMYGRRKVPRRRFTVVATVEPACTSTVGMLARSLGIWTSVFIPRHPWHQKSPQQQLRKGLFESELFFPVDS